MRVSYSFASERGVQGSNKKTQVHTYRIDLHHLIQGLGGLAVGAFVVVLWDGVPLLEVLQGWQN